jgi:hypothetical protein
MRRLTRKAILRAWQQAEWPRATQRVLTETDCDHARAVWVAYRRYCKRAGLQYPSLYLDTGAVCNSYGYRAFSTQLTIRERLGNQYVAVRRTYARRGAYGGRGIVRLTASKAAYETRTWCDMPAFRFGGKSYRFTRRGFLYL